MAAEDPEFQDIPAFLRKDVRKEAESPYVNDPWAHRSAHMRCTTCMWYAPKGSPGKIGRCRRHAPSMNGYPVVMPSDWCGDHKLDETKI